MLKVIYRSATKDIIITFFLTLAFLNSILMMEKLLRLSRLLSGVGATLSDMTKIILLVQPQLFILTIPMALLLSTILVYGRMNMDNEIIIMRTSGMNLWAISFPVVILAVFCFIASIGVSFFVGPKSRLNLRNELTKIVSVRSAHAIEEGTFNTFFKNIVILVKGKKSPDTLEDIFIYDNRHQGEPRVLMAREGTIITQDGSNIGLALLNGYMNITRDRHTTELFFDSYKMTLNLYADPSGPKKAELTPPQLIDRIRRAEQKKERTSLYLELHRRISLPVICILLIFLGTPLSLMAGKSGRLGGLAIGLLVFAVYYLLLIYGENLAMAGSIPHYVGAWGTSCIMGTVALFFFHREKIK